MPARRALAQDAACLAYEAVVDDLEKETRRMVEFLRRGTAAVCAMRPAGIDVNPSLHTVIVDLEIERKAEVRARLFRFTRLNRAPSCSKR
jgi:hypothetical protein